MQQVPDVCSWALKLDIHNGGKNILENSYHGLGRSQEEQVYNSFLFLGNI